MAGHNCKCQDDNGQYDELTRECCNKQIAFKPLIIQYPGPNNQVCSVVHATRSLLDYRSSARVLEMQSIAVHLLIAARVMVLVELSAGLEVA